MRYMFVIMKPRYIRVLKTIPSKGILQFRTSKNYLVTMKRRHISACYNESPLDEIKMHVQWEMHVFLMLKIKLLFFFLFSPFQINVMTMGSTRQSGSYSPPLEQGVRVGNLELYRMLHRHCIPTLRRPAVSPISIHRQTRLRATTHPPHLVTSTWGCMRRLKLLHCLHL